MALTARFTADFSQFDAALQGAAVSINTFERGVKSAAADLNRLASSLSGADIQRQAATLASAIESIGGAARLTASEQQKSLATLDQALEKYRALGEQAPRAVVELAEQLRKLRVANEGVEQSAKEATTAQTAVGRTSEGLTSSLAKLGPMMAATFSVGAVTAFAREIVELGGKIADTSERLGISARAVQEFQYAAEQTGTSIDAIGAAVSKLGKGLVEGKGVVPSLDRLNLSLAELRQMEPDKAFTAVADAIGKVEDPMRQSQIAMELFGRSGTELLPAMKTGIGELATEAEKLGLVLSDDAVKSLADFGDAWDRLVLKLKVGVAETFLQLPDAIRLMKDQVSTIPGLMSGIGRGITEVFHSLGKESAGAAFARGFAIEAAKGIDDSLDAIIGKAFERIDKFDAAIGITRKPVQIGPSDDELERQRLAAEAYRKEITKLRDELSGAALEGEIKRLTEAWNKLTPAQKESQATIDRMLPKLEELTKQHATLTPELEKLYQENRKLIPTIPDVTDRFRNQIIVLGNYSRAAEEARNRIAGLRTDGLLPTRDVLQGMQGALEKIPPKTNDITGAMGRMAEATRKAKEEAEKLTAMNWGATFGTILTDALRGGGWEGAARALGGLLGDTITSSMQAATQKAIKEDTISTAGAFVQGFAGVAVGAFASAYVDAIISAINHDKNFRLAHEAGAALGSEFAAGFGGPKGFRQFAELAGASSDQIARAMVGSAESVQQGIAAITPMLNQYKQALDGLATAAGGTGDIGAGLARQFEAITKARDQARQAKPDIGLEALNKVGSLTAENIDRINNLGLITGGVIANTAGRTGDLVGAIQSVSPALESIAKLREQFQLTGEQLSPATAEVLKLYDTITKNADVYQVVSGLGQTMQGLGNAIAINTPLATAFGQELAAQFTILKDRGVDAGVALSSMAPQLQQLWEASKAGSVTVDETTQALLDQAEAQGIVGDHMKDTNEKVLDVLTEIRDLFSVMLPEAIQRTAGQIEALGPRAGRVIEGTQRQTAGLANTLGTGISQAADRAGESLDRLSRRKIRIPVDFEYGDLPSQVGGGPGAGEGGGVTRVNVNLDGRTIAEATAPHVPGVVEAYGVT
jgi:hypothetical protein